MTKRKFARIAETALNKKILANLAEGNYLSHRKIVDVLGDDLKVKFDWENHDFASHPKLPGLMGLNTLENGLTFQGCWAGGDWEAPVFFIIYWDGKKLRAYVPTDGNPWNTDTDEAFGNDEEADLENAAKRWPNIYGGEVEEVYGEDFEWDAKAILADILDRLEERV